MKKTLSAIIMALAVALIPAAAHTNEQKKIATFGDTQAVDSTCLYEILHHNAPEDFQVSGVPAVVLVGKSAKFLLGVGGYVKVVTGWDFGHPIPSADEFITSQIPMEPMDGDGSRFNLSAKQSHIFLNFVALPGSGNEIGAFVSANFLDGYLPTLQFAYLKYRGIQAGYDYSLFSDPACGTQAVDYEGPCSSTANPVAGINYTWEPDPHGRWQLSAGIELPQYSFTTVEGKTKSVYQRVPDIPIAGRFAWDDGNSWIRVSAIFRNLTYRDEPAHKNHNRFGYGFQLSGAYCFLDKLTLFYQGVWGQGIGSMIQDTVDEGLDLCPSDDDNKLKAVMLWGGFASLQYDISNRFCASATYSQLRTYASHFVGGTTEWGDLYRYAQYVSANVFFHATSYLDVGIEHIWGRRVNYDGSKAADNRLQAAIQLSF